MRRSAVWFLLSALWFVIALLATLRHGWRGGCLQAVAALIFLAIALWMRRRETIRQ